MVVLEPAERLVRVDGIETSFAISCELFGATVGVAYMFCVVWRCYGCFFSILFTYYLYFLSGKFFCCLLFGGAVKWQLPCYL